MKKMRTLDLNLAENPLRNKRLFHTLFFFLCGISVLWFILSLAFFYSYKNKKDDIKASSVQIENKIKQSRREEKRCLSQIETLSKNNLQEVNFINHLISKKGFSWTGLLTALEQSLPEECYIVSISPLQREDTSTEIKLEVASAGWDHLLEFINTLYTMNFRNFRPIRENKSPEGYLITEISLSYEKID